MHRLKTVKVSVCCSCLRNCFLAQPQTFSCGLRSSELATGSKAVHRNQAWPHSPLACAQCGHSLPAAAPRPPHARRMTVACNDPTCHGPTAPVAMHWQASPGTADIEHLPGPSKTAFPWRAESESELGIQRGIHLAFNGHSMGEIWHSRLLGSVEPYFFVHRDRPVSGWKLPHYNIRRCHRARTSTDGSHPGRWQHDPSRSVRVRGSRGVPRPGGNAAGFLLECYTHVAPEESAAPVTMQRAASLCRAASAGVRGSSSTSATRECDVFILRHWLIPQSRKTKTSIVCFRPRRGAETSTRMPHDRSMPTSHVP